jgi:hypothetical protein
MCLGNILARHESQFSQPWSQWKPHEPRSTNARWQPVSAGSKQMKNTKARLAAACFRPAYLMLPPSLRKLPSIARDATYAGVSSVRIGRKSPLEQVKPARFAQYKNRKAENRKRDEAVSLLLTLLSALRFPLAGFRKELRQHLNEQEGEQPS